MNTYIEEKLKEFDEVFLWGKTDEWNGPVADVPDLKAFLTQALEQSFTLGQKSGVELAEGVVPHRDNMRDMTNENMPPTVRAEGFNTCRIETLSALSSLRERLV